MKKIHLILFLFLCFCNVHSEEKGAMSINAINSLRASANQYENLLLKIGLLENTDKEGYSVLVHAILADEIIFDSIYYKEISDVNFFSLQRIRSLSQIRCLMKTKHGNQMGDFFDKLFEYGEIINNEKLDKYLNLISNEDFKEMDNRLYLLYVISNLSYENTYSKYPNQVH